MNRKTLAQILVEIKDDIKHGIYFTEQADKKDAFLSYHDLYEKSLSILEEMYNRGIHAGERVMIQAFTRYDFILSFWACILGGMVPMIFPLQKKNKISLLREMYTAWKRYDTPFLLTSFQKKELFQKDISLHTLFERYSNHILFFEECKMHREGHIRIYEPHLNELAMIQFSSGSTGNPKGVMLTNQNIIENMIDILTRMEFSSLDSSVNWLPLTHDLGMFAFHVSPMYLGVNQHQLSASLFFQNPLIWLDKMSEYHVTSSGSPNFGFQYVLNSYNPEEIYQWDFSNMRIMINGAEKVSGDLCNKFNDMLKKYGLQKNIIRTSYGMSEATLAVSVPSDSLIRGKATKQVNIKIGEQILDLHDSKETSKNETVYINLGKPLAHCQVRICDMYDKELSECFAGVVEIKGENVTSGYYMDEERTKQAFTQEHWYRSEDIGFISEGELYIIGRITDMIIVNGVNLFPSDIESLIKRKFAVDCIAAGVDSNVRQTQEIIVFLQKDWELEKQKEWKRKISAFILKELSLSIRYVLFTNAFPRTESGKVKRLKLKEDFIAGKYDYQFKQEKTNGQYEAEKQKQEVIEIIRSCLFTDEFDDNQNLFEAGMDSSKLMNLTGQLQELDASFRTTDILAEPTVRGILRAIQSHCTRDNVKRTVTRYSLASYYYQLNEYRHKKNMNIEFMISKSVLSSKNIIVKQVVTAFVLCLAQAAERNVIAVQCAVEEKNFFKELQFHLEDYKDKYEMAEQMDFNKYVIAYDDKAMEEWNNNLPGDRFLIYDTSLISPKIYLSKYFNLTIGMTYKDNDILFSMEYDGNYYKTEKMKKFAEIFVQLLQSLIDK